MSTLHLPPVIIIYRVQLSASVLLIKLSLGFENKFVSEVPVYLTFTFI